MAAGAAPHAPSAVDIADATGPQVWADMTVEVALSVMAAAQAGHLVLCDADGRRTGLITQARLSGVRNRPSYTDRVRLADIVDEDRTAANAAPGALAASH
ncbi:CBS domain-containing protein [Streptomyces sp. NBC_01304]|nr:CBS domain-containing protein [Streptomyces sp. NBC_01304]